MRKSKARIRAEALALSAMMASMNVMPALADSVTPEIGIEASKEDESGEKNLASSSNATPVEEDNTNKEIETEENEEDTEEDFEFEEELENDLESSESSENEEDTESSESEKDSSVDSENETKEDMSETEEIESELETEVDLDQIQVATPSDLEKPEEKLLEPELMTLSLREVVYGEWNDSEDGNWKFLPSEDGTCSIKPLSPTVKSGSVTVPEEVDGFTVTSIGASAWNKQKLTEINMSGIKVIETSAFRSCKELKSITLSDVDTIEDSAFYGSGLTSITLDNVGTIETNAFRNCTGLTELNLGTIGTINTSAFNGCSSLTELEIESADTIETYAFYNCAALNNITIRSAGTIKESSVLAKESIHIGHADDIQGMIAKNITIDSAGTVYVGNNTCENMGSSVGNDICETISIGKAENIKRLYANNEIHISDGGTVKGTYPAQPEVKADKVTIDKAECVHKIDGREIVLGDVGEFVYDQALDGDKVNAYFRDNTRIETVSIESVASIPDNCFKFCSNLKNITIGHTDYIGDEAFKDCTVLESISASVDNNIDVIGRAAFMNCQNLKKAEFNNVGTIREYAFQDLQALNTLKINDVGSIEKMAFHNCPLLEELTLGEVGTIGEEAFTLCDSLRTIKAGNVNEIGEAAFKQLKSLTSIVTGDIQNIGAHAFMKCKALETVNIGEVQNMGECAFAFCENLNTLNWTNNLKALPDFAFYKCGKLTSFDLGNVESIGVQALFKCNGIKELTVPAGVESVYLVDLPGEYDYSGKADFSRGYKLTFLGDTDFQHSRSGSDWWCGWLNDKLNDKDDPEIGYVPEIDWRDSIIINEFVLPSKDCKAYKRMTDKNNTDIIPKIEGDSKNVLYHAVNDELRSKYINEFTSEETTEYHWSSFRTLPDVDGNDNQHVIIEAAKVNGNTEDDNKEKVTVTFWMNDGTEDIWRRLEDVEKGSMLQVNHSELGKEKYEFTGWYMEPECENKAENRILVEKDLDLYAGWKLKDTEDDNKEKVTVTFYRNDDTEDIHKREEIEKNTIPSFNDTPTRDHHIFIGWYKDPEGTQLVDINEPVGEDTNYYAKWQEIKESINVTFYRNDDTYMIWTFMSADKGSHPDLSSVSIPTRNGYEFKGWYMEPECINEASEDLVMNQDTDFYAKWESTENDDNKEKIAVKYWYNDGTENIFKIEQMEKGRAIKENGRFDESDIPTRDGYEFKGWYFESECETVVLPFRTLESDTDFYAKWERKDTGSGSGGGGGGSDVKEKITITYYLNDGTEDIFKRDQIEKGDSPDMSVEPSRKGYEFKGWYYEAECENRVPDDITVDKDTDFYASWNKIDSGGSGGGGGESPDKPDDKEEKIKVTYYENDGTPDIYKTEKIEKGDTPDTSGEPKRDGYEFKGWYEEPECETPVDPSKPLDEDTDFYAKWEKKDTAPSGDDKPDDKNEDDKKPDDKPDKVEKVKVTYHNNDDTDKIYKTEEIEKGGTPDTKGNPDRDKYEFTGWYLDPECKVPVDPSKPLDEDTDLYAGWKKKDTIPTGNGSHGGGGSHGGSTVRVVNVHEDKPEPEKTTIGENGVPQGDTDKEEVNTSTLNENGVPKDRAEEKDSLPKTGDKRNILVYWITFISSLSSMAVTGLKDRLKRVSRQRKN